MPLDNLKENTEEIQDRFRDVIDSYVAYYKLWFFKVTMKSATMLVKVILLFLFFIIALFFCSVAGAIALGIYLNSYTLGFLAIGGFYIFLMIIVYFIKDKIMEGSLLEKFSEVFFND